MTIQMSRGVFSFWLVVSRRCAIAEIGITMSTGAAISKLVDSTNTTLKSD